MRACLIAVCIARASGECVCEFNRNLIGSYVDRNTTQLAEGSRRQICVLTLAVQGNARSRWRQLHLFSQEDPAD